MVNQVIAEEKQGPHSLVEPVPTRSGGNNENITDDKLRAKYGEDPINGISSGEGIAIESPNDTKTPNNPTRDERIRGSNSDNNPQTGYSRAMVA